MKTCTHDATATITYKDAQGEHKRCLLCCKDQEAADRLYQSMALYYRVNAFNVRAKGFAQMYREDHAND